VLAGACEGVVVDDDWTAAVALDATVCAPRLFDAVILMRRRAPTSSAASVYVDVSAPEIAVQFEASERPPSAPQRIHW
jgi:hypothetical protein